MAPGLAHYGMLRLCMNFSQKFKFWSKKFVRNRNFTQKLKFFVKNRNFSQKLNFWSKEFVKNLNASNV